MSRATLACPWIINTDSSFDILSYGLIFSATCRRWSRVWSTTSELDLTIKVLIRARPTSFISRVERHLKLLVYQNLGILIRLGRHQYSAMGPLGAFLRFPALRVSTLTSSWWTAGNVLFLPLAAVSRRPLKSVLEFRWLPSSFLSGEDTQLSLQHTVYVHTVFIEP